jgi:thiosulfate dehydrogenase (quinone) large subunit
LIAGWHKFTTPAWMDGSGAGIIGFWKGALGTTQAGAPVITFDWYRTFIQLLVDSNSAGWFSYVIVFGELAVGLGLIFGAFTGVAAAGGLVMNMAFLLAGTTSTNPVLVILDIFLILAWKNAGYIGLDRYLLPMLGTPWPQKPPAKARVPIVATATR